jgi:GNAT superfamily N-acetyltransferase
MDINCTVRPARTSDIGRMCELLSDLFSIEADFTPDRGKQARGLELLINDTSGSGAVFVAEAHGEVIGMCTVQTLVSTSQGGTVGLLEDLVVRKDLRGRGVGGSLLSHTLAYCAERGITRVQLLRDADNSRALDFYARNGWCDTSLVCMRKLL